MTAPAAIKATYSDLKFVKSRKVAQITVEIPIEQSSDFVAMFGTPNPATETWVALARMSDEKAQTEQPKERRRFNTLPPAQQAGMRCADLAFQRFLHERKNAKAIGENEAIAEVRRICGVVTRADLVPGSQAASTWHELNAEFDVWMRSAA